MLGSDTLAFDSEIPEELKDDDLAKGERNSPPRDVTVPPKPKGKWRGESMYPKLLQELITTVLSREAFLFSDLERAHLRHLSSLPYGPRYLFTRLALRRRSKLHRLSDLHTRYSEELGEDIPSFMGALCSHPLPSFRAGNLGSDLAFRVENDSEDGPTESEGGGLCPPQDKYPELYAHDESRLATDELLAALKVDEIRDIATALRVHKTKVTRAELIQALLDTTSKQATLPFAAYKAPPKQAFIEVPTTPPPSPKRERVVIDLVSPPRAAARPAVNQTNRLRELVLGVESKFIRISESMFNLLQRINLVYFRVTEMESNAILLPLILSRSKKRKYPDYVTTRTIEVFKSREHLVAYETALQLEADIDKALSEGGDTKVERAEKAYMLFESIYTRWKHLVAEMHANGEEGAYARPGLERFEEGHVLTRIVCKGADALAMLHRYEEEVTLLRELLSQKRWRKGKRGVWYDRLALVLMHHLSKPQEAIRVVVDALKDELTHIVTRPRLERRLTRLEKRLKINEGMRHTSDAQARKCEESTIEGCRVRHTRQQSTASITSYFNSRGPSRSLSPLLTHNHLDPTKNSLKGPQGIHSLWLSRNGEEIGVEELVLEHYSTLGYKGYHSEGRIVRHIFLLLFWSIIFQPVEGAFETSYQIAPLDIGHDSFYFARKSDVEARLKEIEDGEGIRIARETDERERKHNTFAIGAAWELCTKEDVIEIIQCLGGKSLAFICRVICEDYTHRSSGVPDLLIWNMLESTAKFVEVKGPGDTLMENQKVWIDVLLGAGIDVEVCHVREKGVSEVKMKSKNKALAPASAKSKAGQRGSHYKEDRPASTRHASDSKLNAKRNTTQQHPIVIGDSDDDDGLPPTHNHSFFKRTRTMSDSATVSAKRGRLS